LPLLVACNPEFANRFSTLDAPRVLAVQATPAEAAPGNRVSYRLLVADQQGTVLRPEADWSFCTQAKPISELNDVAAECFGTGDFVQPFASGATASGVIPKNACRQFGPDIPQTLAGEPPGRPTDPDSSGGFYQPVIVSVQAGGETISTLAETRITCGLANGSGDLETYRTQSKPNQNPVLSQVVASSLGGAVLSDGTATEPLSVARGQTVTLSASWPSCPSEPSCGDGMCTSGETLSGCPLDCTTPVGCTGPEQYAYVDPATSQLSPRHEAMRVSWFATVGAFRDDHTGRLEEEFALTSSDNAWTAPATAGPVFMWVVLRDARGGVDWQSLRLQVE
jgi:hypothetical protein